MPPKYSVIPVKQDSGWAGNWWDKRHAQKIKQSKGADIDLLMLGDSITQGWEENAKGWQHFYQDRKAFNLGFNGDRTEHVLWRLRNGAVESMSPKLVVLMVGTNNTGQRMDPAEHTAEGVLAIVNELRERLPQSKILLLGIFPREESPYNEMRKRNESINKIISKYEDKKSVFYLNINQVFLDEKQILSEDIMPDFLHPNELGYRLWAEAIEPTIQQLMY